MCDADEILAVLRTILDPEMPISIVDLGLVEEVLVEPGEDAPEQARVSITLLPTFVGCPALSMIERLVREKVAALPGVAGVRVRFVNDPPWTVERISDAGRAALREFGVTTPARGACGGAGLDASSGTSVALTASAAADNASAPACPFCDSDATRQVSRFGPTRCKMIYYCDACKNSFEHLKPI